MIGLKTIRNMMGLSGSPWNTPLLKGNPSVKKYSYSYFFDTHIDYHIYVSVSEEIYSLFLISYPNVIHNISWSRTIFYIIEPKTFCISDWLNWLYFLRLLFSNRLHHFTPPLFESNYKLDPGSYCVNGLSYLVAPRLQYF